MRTEPECSGEMYFCPTAMQDESAHHGGFDVCCDRPDLHVPLGEKDFCTPQPCCRSHREPTEAVYACNTVPGASDPCCNNCHYWVAWIRKLDGEDED